MTEPLKALVMPNPAPMSLHVQTKCLTRPTNGRTLHDNPNNARLERIKQVVVCGAKPADIEIIKLRIIAQRFVFRRYMTIAPYDIGMAVVTKMD
jgi:hypothetical protein